MNPIAVSGLGATAEADLPTKKEVKEGYDYYLALAPRNQLPKRDSNGNIPPDEAIAWSVQALENWERTSGGKQSSEFKLMVATARDFKGLNMNQAQTRAYAEALGEISGAASSDYYNVAVTAGVVTVDSLKDGKITQDEAVAMGTTVGAVAGAVVGQAIGVPAPIGAFVGGTIGGGSAAIIYHVFGAPSWKQMQKAREAKIRAELNKFRHDALTACIEFERDYWKQFDQFINDYAIAWTHAEMEIGWRFGLRWFDRNPGLEFEYLWDKSKGHATKDKGRRTDTMGERYGCKSVAYQSSAGTTREQVCLYRCPFVYGCPYPDLYEGVAGGPTPTDVVPSALEGGMRVVHAFAARGVLWLPQKKQSKWERPDCEEYIIKPPSDAYHAANDQVRRTYKGNVQTRLRNLDDLYMRYIRARTFLQADLTRTIAVVRAEHDLYVNKAQYITVGGGSSAIADAAAQSKMLSNIVNGVAFAGGLGLLGYAMYRGLK